MRGYGDGSVDNDFARLAVLDAYKGWITTDFGFLQLTGVLDPAGVAIDTELGRFNAHTMRKIAKAYTVSRNIPAHEDDRQGVQLAEFLCSSEVTQVLKLPFARRAEGLTDLVHRNPVVLAENKNGENVKRKIASAFSKLTWFLRPNDWTIFDKYVGAAALREEGTGPKQMRAYYEALRRTWTATSTALVDASVAHGMNSLLGLRIVDKYLFLHGIGMYRRATGKDGSPKDKLDPLSTISDRLTHLTVISARRSLMSFAQALPRDLREELFSLADDVAPVLMASGWIDDPA
jgi:hypothetical protein